MRTRPSSGIALMLALVAGSTATAQAPPTNGIWPTANVLPANARVMVMDRNHPPFSCRVLDIGQDALTCAGKKPGSTVTFARDQVATIEWKAQNHHGGAFITGGVAAGGAGALCNGSGCAGPVAVSLGLITTGVVLMVHDHRMRHRHAGPLYAAPPDVPQSVLTTPVAP